MIEHCVLAFGNYADQKVYQEYVTDGLMYLLESVTSYYGGTYLQRRYADIINGVKEEEVSADEIVLEVMQKAGLSVKE